MASKPRPTIKPPKRAATRFARQLIEAHVTQLNRHIQRNGIRGVDQLYRAARGEILDRLKSASKSTSPSDAATMRAMLGQVEHVLVELGTEIERSLKEHGRTTQEMAARQSIDEYRKLERYYRGTTPIVDLDVPAVFKGMIDGVEPSLLRRYRLQTQTWTIGAIQKTERFLATQSMIGRPLFETVSSLTDSLETERYKAERIVRTELAYAAGVQKQQTMEDTKRELSIGGLQKKWIETFDDRTGDDSFLMHGQTVPVDQPFTYKHRKGGSWVVTKIMGSPNRPNDRSTVIPWDPEWEATELERPLTIAELRTARPTRWRSTPGVIVPPGQRPGLPYLG